MRRSILYAGLLGLLCSTRIWAATPASTAPDADKSPAKAVQCRQAVVNPVSRYAVCVDPPGAPVAQIPHDVAPPCPSHPGNQAAFSMQSRCTPASASSTSTPGN